jgi:omega-6 fatty acid desaturase (delta-12 desaturase)
MSRRQRLNYLVARHPVTVLCAYFTVFVYGVCLSSFLRDPKKNWDSGLALGVHVTLSAAVLFFGGLQTYVFALLIPFLVAHALGAYLFYAQHNFPAIRIAPRERWSYARAVLELHPHELGDGVVHGQHRLPPRAPSEPFHPVLSAP